MSCFKVYNSAVESCGVCSIKSISPKSLWRGGITFLWCHYSRWFKTTREEEENGGCQVFQLSDSGSQKIQTIVGAFFFHQPCN